jgi:acyl-coenzyme A thioesterase PaaI-like protein
MANATLDTWHKVTRFPAGKAIFSVLAGVQVPYTGSIGARVEELRPGYARVSLRDRRKVRNHLKSIHAVALTNLAEMTGNLALMTAQGPGARWIITSFETTFLKKARGRITAECMIEFDPNVAGEYAGRVVLRDAANETVAEAAPRWKISAK